MTRSDRAMQDFLAEAEELLEGADKDIDAVETALRQNKKPRPDAVNRLFRHLHSLKGLAGMAGVSAIADLSHDLEDYLDKIRLGKRPLDLDAAGLLVQSVALLRQLCRETGDGGAPRADIQPLAKRIFAAASGNATTAAADWRTRTTLEPEVMLTLSEYEEHRLRENIESGMPVYSLVVSYSFDDFDVRLRALTEKIAENGELVSTLPVANGPSDKLTFRLLVAHEAGESGMQALAAYGGGVYDSISKNAPDTGGTAAAAANAPAKPSAAAGRAAKTGAAKAGAETLALSEPAAEPGAEGGAAATNNVRVDIAKLDAVMGLIGEIALVKVRLVALGRELNAQGDAQRGPAMLLARANRELEKKLNELQKSVVDIRMVPVGQIFSRLARFARRLAPELEKHVDVHLFGEETELDKAMVEAVSAPLMHVIRNSLDHGIEPPEARIFAGKPAVGVLKLEAFQRGNNVVLRVSDDGHGIDAGKVRSRAIERGLIAPDAELSTEEVQDLIFLPGFSTADQVSEISGRGVGLDVVRKAITELKGQIGVDSEADRGTTFEITLPITLAIIQSLLVRAAGRPLVIPLSAVAETLRMKIGEIQWVDRKPVINLRGRSLPLLWVEDFFKFTGGEARDPNRRIFVVIVKIAERSIGLVVDLITGQQEVVIKPLGRLLSKLPGIAGATELGQGEPVLVVDVASMMNPGKTLELKQVS